MIQRVEKQRLVTNGVGVVREIAAHVSKGGSIGNNDSEPLSAAFSARNSSRGRRDVRDKKATRYCTHCKKSGHIMDQCFKLVGYPYWYKGQCDNVKGRPPVRLAANAIGQDLCDTPLEETSCREVSPNQVDTGWVQALVAQEMKKWTQGKQSQQVDLANRSFGSGSVRVKFGLGKVRVTQVLFRFRFGSG